MALEAAAWITRGEHKQDSGIFIASANEHDRVVLQSANKSNLAQTNRFTQTEQSNGYLCSSNGRPVKEAQVMFDQNVQVQQQQHQQQQHQQQQHQQQQQSMYSQSSKKECDKNAVIAEFPFCYNMNVLQKAQQETVATSNVASIVMDGDKACYRFDVSQPFTYNYALVNQMSLAAATSTTNVKCDICGLTFANLSLLNNHKRIHSNISTQPHTSNFSCNTCGCGFTDATELKSHRISAHKVRCCTSCGVEITCEKSGKKSKLLKCENCINISNNFVNNQTTPASNTNGTMENTSVKNHHPVKRKGLATVTKCHKCNGSGIIFIGVSRNMDSTKPFQCNICNGRFSRYSSLWSHKRLHTGDKPFKCDVCGLGFAKAAYLKNHSRTHTGEKPFKCEICGMQFSQSPHLKNHERIHSGERPYQCEVCEKTFARHSTLWNHRRIHTGEKPYRCDICGSAFNQATHLKNHGKVHTGEKPHRCTVCAVGFSDRFALKRHQKIHEKYARQNNNEQQSQQQQTPMDNVFKYEVTGPIAFPGCTRPQEK